jgi:hypothetical protein
MKSLRPSAPHSRPLRLKRILMLNLFQHLLHAWQTLKQVQGDGVFVYIFNFSL